jgi:hypothetical protein
MIVRHEVFLNPIYSVKPNLEIASVHTAMIGTISTPIIIRQQPPKLHNSKTNLEAFITQIGEKLRPNIPPKTAEDIDQAITELNNVIQKVAWSATPDDKPRAS